MLFPFINVCQRVRLTDNRPTTVYWPLPRSLLSSLCPAKGHEIDSVVEVNNVKVCYLGTLSFGMCVSFSLHVAYYIINCIYLLSYTFWVEPRSD